MTAPPLAYPAITMMDKYASPADEKGKKLDVPQRLVGIGEVDLCCFRCPGSLRVHLPPLNARIPDGILLVYPFSREALSHPSPWMGLR